MLLSPEPRGYQPIEQYDSIEEDVIEMDDPTKVLNPLRKLFVKSSFIQGYLGSISQNITSTNIDIDFDPIYGVICDFYGIISLYNAVQIQSNQIVKYLYNNKMQPKPITINDELDDGEKNTENCLLLAINNGNIQIVRTIIDYDYQLLSRYTNKPIPNYPPFNYQQSSFLSQTCNPLISLCIDKLFEHKSNHEQSMKYMEITKVLLDHKISPNGLSQKANASLLHYACLKQDFEFIKSLIKEYKIAVNIASKKDIHQHIAIDYLDETELNEIREYLENEIIAYNALYSFHDNNHDIPMDSGVGCAYFVILSICCFIPWSIIGIVNAGFYLSKLTTIHWSLTVINIIIILLGIGMIGILSVCAITTVYKVPQLVSKAWIGIVLLQQLFYVTLLIVVLVLDEYTKTTLALSITNVCFVVCLNILLLCAYCGVFRNC